MSDFTPSTLPSPRSPLFSDSDAPSRQSGSEIVTSDEEPDLGAFTTVLRAWGYLQPPLRIPTHFPSSSSSNETWTPTTITGYPGFGGGTASEVGVAESTVWNRIPIQSYLRRGSSFGTGVSSASTVQVRAVRSSVLQEFDEEEDEDDGEEVQVEEEVGYPLSSPPPSPASDGARTVEIGSEAEGGSVHSVSYEDGASGERLAVPVPRVIPPSIDGRTVSVASIISRQLPALSVVSYQRRRSVFQEESPSPGVQTTTSRPPNSRVVSDIINSYYAQAQGGISSPSVDQPVSDFLRPALSSLALGVEQRQEPLLEQDSPLLTQSQGQRRPSIIDDNSTAPSSAVTMDSDDISSSTTEEEGPRSVLQEMTESDSDSHGNSRSESASHDSVTPMIIQPPTSISASLSSTTTTTATVNHTRQPSLDLSNVMHHPSLASTFQQQQQQQQPDGSFDAPGSSRFQHHYHSLSSEGDPAPSLGYLDEALSFIAQERARWNAQRVVNRGSSPGSSSGGIRDEDVPSAGDTASTVFRQQGAGTGGTWRYAIDPDSQSQRASETDRQLRLQHRHHLQHHEANSGVTPPTAATSSAGDRIPNTLTRPTLESNPSSSSAASENILLLNSPGPRESRRKKNKLSSSDGKTITILKRAPEASGSGSNAYGALSSGMVAVGLNDANYNNNTHHYHHGGDGGLSSSYSHSHLHTRSHSSTRDSHVEATATTTTTTTTTTHTQAHANATVGESLLSATATSTKADGATTPRAYDIGHVYEDRGYGYLYPRDRRQRDFGSGEGEEEEGDDGGGEEGGGGEMEWCIDKYGQRRRRRKGTIPSRLVHDGNGDSLAVMGGVGEMEWYLDRYGRRQRRIRSWEATAVYEPHSRRRESGPNGVIYGGMDEDRHDEDRHDEDEDEDEDEEEAEEEEEESGSESESATEQSLIRPPEAITGSVAEEEGAEDANGDPLTEEKTNTKTKAKRKKTKKRKVPVTHPLSSTGAALASALAHSHSVPNLRSTITTTGSADLSTTEAEDGDGDEDDYDRDDRREVASSSSTSGGDKDVRGVDGDFPGLSPGLGNGLGLSTTTTTLGTGTVTLKKEKKEKKKKKKEKPVFVLRGDPQLGRSLGIIFATTTDDSAAEEFGFGFGKQRQRHARLVLLARHLQVLFPEETEVLGKVVAKLAPPPPPGFVSDNTRAGLSKKEKKKQKQKKGSSVLFLDDDCSLEYSSLASSDLQRATAATERGDGFPFGFDGYGYDPDPRGDVPGRKDTLVHVFIDHSNILIGLLSHIKRTSRKLKIPPSSSSSSKHVYPPSTDGITRSTNTTGSRPLPIPKTKAGVPVLETKPIIPLPSFAVSRSAPSTMSKSALKSALLAHHYDVAGEDSGDVNDLGSSGVEIDGEEEDVPVFEFEDERYGFEKSTRGVKEGQGILLAAVGLKAKQKQKEKQKEKAAVAIKRSPHLWHAALALVLERGRPVTRRVVVASSPLYQPMDDMERLGYEVSVLTRVPDLGDGADRLEKAARHESSSSHNKDADYNNNYYGSSSPTKGSRSIGKSHSRRILMNGESSMGSTSSGGAATQTTGQGSTPLRVKYREQGVDELLQLKLLTVIAATERVPEGATIVLATGDGNVGQFNEDGYLGPVRMALKHGWKVELYAWEDGLSRSWRREFGPTSEWGRKGMFRVIAMEQFAECLVDLGY